MIQHNHYVFGKLHFNSMSIHPNHAKNAYFTSRVEVLFFMMKVYADPSNGNFI